MSRPKKVVLLIDAEERRRSVRDFLLRTRGYAVQECSPDELPRECKNMRDLVLGAVDVAIVDMDEGASAICERLGKAAPEMRVFLIGGDRGSQRAFNVAAWVPRSDQAGQSSAELLERLRIIAARKRGPKKASQSVTAEMAEEVVA